MKRAIHDVTFVKVGTMSSLLFHKSWRPFSVSCLRRNVEEVISEFNMSKIFQLGSCAIFVLCCFASVTASSSEKALEDDDYFPAYYTCPDTRKLSFLLVKCLVSFCALQRGEWQTVYDNININSSRERKQSLHLFSTSQRLSQARCK